MSLLKFIKEVRDYFILHAVAAHFSNGLVPIAVLFLVLAFVSGDPFVDRTVLHLLLVVIVAAPVSLVSGILDWRRKFHGRTAPIFTRKIILSVVLLLLTAASIALRLTQPELIREQGLFFWLYAACIALMFGAVFLLGHYGAKLATMVRHAPAAATSDQ